MKKIPFGIALIVMEGEDVSGLTSLRLVKLQVV